MKKKLSLRERAIGLLARREHSRAELARKLRAHTEEGKDGAEVETLLNDLERRKLLSDRRYAEARAHSLSSRYGRARIVHELRRQGIADATIAPISAELKGSELARAQAAWHKRFGRLPQDTTERARQFRFLQARGFPAELIFRLLRLEND
jgi:regulatory protein